MQTRARRAFGKVLQCRQQPSNAVLSFKTWARTQEIVTECQVRRCQRTQNAVAVYPVRFF